MTYIETFSDARSPPRNTFDNVRDAYIDIKKFANFSNVSISVWKYRNIEPKYYKGRFLRYGPVYNTAITNKIFLDIDLINKKGELRYELLERFYKLYNWVIDGEYTREITFTGGGFQLIFAVNTSPLKYAAVYYDLKNKFKIVDKEYASLEKMRRVPGSFNFGKDKKSKRNLYCISLKDNEVFMPFEDIIEMAHKSRGKIYRMGHETYIPNVKGNVQYVYKLDTKSNYSVNDAVDKILNGYGWEYNDICPTIRSLIEQNTVGHYDRVFIIKYLRSILNIKFGDILILLPKLLTGDHGAENDGEHSINEGQPHSIYKSGSEFSPKSLRSIGLCDPNCDKCDRYLKMKRRIL